MYITSLAKTIKIMSFLFAQSVREIVSNIYCKKYIKLYSYFFHFSFLYGGPKRNFANTLEGKLKPFQGTQFGLVVVLSYTFWNSISRGEHK